MCIVRYAGDAFHGEFAELEYIDFTLIKHNKFNSSVLIRFRRILGPYYTNIILIACAVNYKYKIVEKWKLPHLYDLAVLKCRSMHCNLYNGSLQY